MEQSTPCRFTVHLALCLLALNVALTPELATARSAETQERVATEAQIGQIERAFDALEKAAAAIPRDTFDPEAILDSVEPEIEPLFEWVRDNTYLVPYSGALRGPVGVLMDRMGNSLDRALLLNTLLQQVGYETRLAAGRLLPEAARDLMAAARPVPAGGGLPEETAAEEQVISELRRYAADFGLDENALIDGHREATRERERLRVEARKRVREQTRFLAELIGPAPAGAAEELRRRQLATLEEHWWVQVQDGTRWVDLDPSYPNAPAGWAATAARRTLEAETLGDLPPELRHTVQIRLVLECWQGGGLAEHTLLESVPLLPVDLLGEPLTLGHVPVHWPADADLLGAAEPGRLLREALDKENVWAPVLTVGSASVLNLAYGESCKLSDARGELDSIIQTGKTIGRKMGGLAGAIAGLGGPDEHDAAEEAAGSVTAQWIEYEIRVPGEQPQVIRRQVFDRIGSEARREPESLTREGSLQDSSWRLALIGTTDILLLGSALSPDFVQVQMAESVHPLRSAVLDVVKGAGATQDLKVSPKPKVPSVELLALALARSESSGLTNRVFIERPNVLAFHRQLKAVGISEMRLLYAFDIVSNRVGAIDRDGESARLERLARGVADSSAEVLLAGALCDGADLTDCEPSSSAGDLLAEDSDPKLWTVLRSTGELDRIDKRISRAQRIRMENELQEGAWLVQPSPDSSLNWSEGHWWRIDPRRGDALTIDERGWGAEMVEYLVVYSIRGLFALECVLETIACGNLATAFLCASGFLGPVFNWRAFSLEWLSRGGKFGRFLTGSIGAILGYLFGQVLSTTMPNFWNLRGAC